MSGRETRMATVDLATLHCLFGVAGKPSYVKAASEQVHHSGAAPQACADGMDGQYPCDSRDATYVSALKIAAARADGLDTSALEGSVMKFAKFWQIEDDVKGAMDKVASHLAPVVLEDSDYAMVESYQGQPIRKYASYDADSASEAANAFYDNRTRYPLAWRQKTARALIKKAREHGADLNPGVESYLFKAAGFGFPSAEAVEDALIGRLNHCSGGIRKSAGEKLASALGAIADSPQLRFNHDLVTDMLEITDRFDREMKLAAFYDQDVDLPEEMLELTTTMVKHAGEVEQGGMVNLQNGSAVNVHHLSKEALEAVDDDLAKMSKRKLAKVLPTLPSPDADVLCKAAGVVKTAAPLMERPGLPEQKKVKPSEGTPSIGKPPSNKDLAKKGQDMMGGGMPPPPADPAAAGAMPGPGAIPGAPAPGAVPGAGMGGAPAPGTPEPAPNLPVTPGQEAKPGQAPGAEAAPPGMDPGAVGAAGAPPPESGMDPGAVAAPPVEPAADLGGGNALFDNTGILDDPSITGAASPGAEGAGAANTLMAGAGAEDDASGMPGEPAGMPTPAASEVIKDDVSGIPAPMPVQ